LDLALIQRLGINLIVVGRRFHAFADAVNCRRFDKMGADKYR